MSVVLFLRTLVGWPAIVVSTLLHAVLIGLFGESETSERVLRNWGRLFIWITGAQVIAKSHAPLDPQKSYVFVSNHTSNLDAPVIVYLARRPLRFIAKRELEVIPIFGWAAKRMGHVFIDRRDRQRSTRAIRERIAQGLRGGTLFFFAEGTRSTKDELLPFKKGAAVAALETGLEWVPIAVAGARDVLKPKGLSLFRPGPVAVVFGAPRSIAGHTIDERDLLVQEQRAAVEQALNEARALVLKARAGSGT